MTDPAERRSLIPRGTFEQRDTAPDAEPPAPLQSYIAQLRQRFDEVADVVDDAALTVPPDAQPRDWVASDIESALQAMTETVLRSPSSPDSPLVFPTGNPQAQVLPLLPSPSLVPCVHVPPAADVTPRNVRRRADDLVGDFPVELDDAPASTLPTRKREAKSGRFVAPAGLRIAVEQDGSIAAVVTQMISAEQEPAQSRGRDARTQAATPLDAPAADDESEPAYAVPGVPAVAPTSASNAAWSPLVLRGALVFAASVITGGATVYFLMHG